MRHTLVPRLLTALVLTLLLSLPAVAQTGTMPVVTKSVAFRNATVVPSPGQQIDGATVVIRDGVITAVGTDVAIPYDARIIDADSLYIYAGFVDALSYAGLEAPRPQRGGAQQGQQSVSRANPPPEIAGLQPDRDVRSLLKADDSSVTDLRSAGFTAAHSVPYGRMMPGSGAVVLLHGDTADEMVLSTQASLFVQFQGARGVYPGTPMAMTAKFRQIYREASRRLNHQKLYDEDPSGMPRPPYDALHAAFFPVLEGERTVFFHVDGALEAHRALGLREELGFRMVLTGLDEGYDLAEKLSRSGVGMAVTLDLPEKPEWMREMKRDSLMAVIANYDPDMRLATYADLEGELRNLEARQARSREAYVSNAGLLAAAGLSFAFTTAGADAKDVHGNLREMIAAGLDETAALAALTVNAADLIGTGRIMGSVEAGKMGNLAIATGPLFEEDTRLVHTVIEGRVYDIEQPRSRGGSRTGAGTVSPTGTWAGTVDSPDGALAATIVIEGSAGDYSAVVRYDGVDQGIPIPEVTLDGNELSFSFSGPDGPVAVRATIVGDRMTGSADTDAGSLTLTFERRGPGLR